MALSSLRIDVARPIEELPVLPTTLVRLLQLDRTSNHFFDEVVALIEREPTYAARVLAMASSAMYHGVSPASRLRDAVLRMGLGTTTNLIVALSVARVFLPTTNWERALWVHSLTVASLAKALAPISGQLVNPDDAYLCGLLHDLGRFILFNEAAHQLKTVEQADWHSADQLVHAERAICGIDHAELGAASAARWGLPPQVVAVIRHHHAPPAPGQTLLGLVQIADGLDFFDVSPNHDVADSLAHATPAIIESRLKKLLPSWYRGKPDVVAPLVMQALEQSLHDANALLPGQAD